ncbi:MAG: MBL fold metallo-hydrolase [archaeon]
MYEVQYLGHSFFKVKFPKVTVLIDPYIKLETNSKDFTRLIKCPVSEKHLKDTDLILVTHEHFDHFDHQAIEDIAKNNKSLVGSSSEILNQLKISPSLKIQLEPNKTFKLRGLSVKPISVHHPTSFCPMGYSVGDENFTVFHSGDTQLMDSLKSIKADIAFLPIGGGNMTMDVVDAVRTVKMMKPKYAIPMHYNTFKMIKAQPLEFKEKIDKSIIPTKPLIMKVGETIKF